MQLGTRLECVGSLPGRRKRVYLKKIETRQKIIMGNRKAYKEFNHDGEKESQTRDGPRIKLRHQAKVWRCSGSSLGTADGSEPPRMVAELPVPCFQGAFDGYIIDTDG
ncbi:hypothetical protein BHE74_00059190 [Ensete ventricosum]|nr:hypothetical protein BHE74_00059190 [Ensete ventricosum]